MRTARAGIVGLLCVVLLTLTGCVKVDLDLEVHSDDTISGTLIMGVSKEVPNAEQAVDQLQGQLPPGATSEPWSDDKFVGVQITYDNTPIDQFSTPSAGMGGDTGLGLRREGDFFILGSPDAETDSPDLTGLQPVYRVRLTFPGPVVEGTGQIDGRSIEWTDMNVNPYVKARATSVVLVPLLIGAAVVLVLAAAALVVFLALRRQRASHRTAEAQPTWAAPQDQSGTGQYGTSQYGTSQYGTSQYGTSQYGGQDQTQYGGQDPTQFTGATVDPPWDGGRPDGPSTGTSEPDDTSPWQRPQ